jgi:hypothetical protein
MPGRYPVESVGKLARQGRVVATKRVTQWLTNHDYDVKETILGVLVVNVWSCCWDGVVH